MKSRRVAIALLLFSAFLSTFYITNVLWNSIPNVTLDELINTVAMCCALWGNYTFLRMLE